MKIAAPNMDMGYDRAITIFSPEGRLLQVEYAQKAVSSGAISMGITCKDSVILIANRRKVDTLLVADAVKKIFNMDKHVGVAAAGIMADARILVRIGREKAQQHMLTYGERIDVDSLVRHLADLMQAYTQYGGTRPFGISLLFGGVDKKGPGLFVADPTGTYFQYKAFAVGDGSAAANTLLATSYKPGMSTEQGLKLAQSILKKVLKREYSAEKIECVIAKRSGLKKEIIK